MDFLLDALTQWLKEMLVGGIMGNLSGLFDSVNRQVADIATQVGQTPQGWNGSIFSMIQNLSNSIMVPIAGVILAIVMTLELIQMITDRNNLHDVDTWMIFKWVFKSAAAILIVTNTWNIVMGVFDMAQSVVAQAAGIIGSDASIDISSVMGDMETRLMKMDLGPLIGLWAQSLVIGITMWALYICIFIVIYGRMIEIYLVTSVAPIPMATMMSKESGGMGQNYLVPVPKDLTKVKTKVAFNLTKRQLVCFSGGALIGVPLFFLLRGPAGNSVAAMCMMLVMLPFFMLAMYEKHGQPLEKIVGNIIRVTVIRPKQRPYRTNNFYAVLQRQANLDEEVYDIVHGNQKLAAPAVRKNRGKSCAAGQDKEKAVPRRQKAD